MLGAREVARLGQRMQCGDHQVVAIDFEELTQRRARITTPKAIGAERAEAGRDVRRDQLRIGADVIRRRDDGGEPRQLLLHKTDARGSARLQAIRTFDLARLAR